MPGLEADQAITRVLGSTVDHYAWKITVKMVTNNIILKWNRMLDSHITQGQYYR